jgi:hypothetical protein
MNSNRLDTYNSGTLLTSKATMEEVVHRRPTSYMREGSGWLCGCRNNIKRCCLLHDSRGSWQRSTAASHNRDTGSVSVKFMLCWWWVWGRWGVSTLVRVFMFLPSSHCSVSALYLSSPLRSDKLFARINQMYRVILNCCLGFRGR